MTEEERRRLLGRVDRTFGDLAVDQAMRPVRAIVGPRMPNGQEAAQRARDKLKADQTPAPSELAALEVMIRLLRPALLCRHGMFDDLSTNNEYTATLRALWTGFRPQIATFAFSVGRIDTASGTRLGTGFLVAPNKIVTNHHVLEALSFGTFELERGQGVIRFQQQWEPADTESAIDITRVVADEPFLDIAILEIDPPAGFNRPSLQFDSADSNEGDFVAVVGYPMKDGLRNPRFTDSLFEGRYDVKRAAPGEIVKATTPLVYHDCSTLGGNSGSPVLSLKSANVVGLHRSGTFMYRNEAVQVTALRQFVSAH